LAYAGSFFTAGLEVDAGKPAPAFRSGLTGPLAVIPAAASPALLFASACSPSVVGGALVAGA